MSKSDMRNRRIIPRRFRPEYGPLQDRLVARRAARHMKKYRDLPYGSEFKITEESVENILIAINISCNRKNSRSFQSFEFDRDTIIASRGISQLDKPVKHIFLSFLQTTFGTTTVLNEAFLLQFHVSFNSIWSKEFNREMEVRQPDDYERHKVSISDQIHVGDYDGVLARLNQADDAGQDPVTVLERCALRCLVFLKKRSVIEFLVTSERFVEIVTEVTNNSTWDEYGDGKYASLHFRGTAVLNCIIKIQDLTRIAVKWTEDLATSTRLNLLTIQLAKLCSLY
jgi:hypothetical protein